MNETSGDSVYDQTANLRNGYTAGADIVSGKIGNARSFVGTNSDNIAIRAGGGLNNQQTGAITCWVKWSGTQDADIQSQGYGAITSRQKDATFSQQIIALDAADPATGKIQWRPYAFNVPVITSSAATGDGTWHYLVINYSSGAHRLYVDAVSDGTATTTGSITNDINIPLSIGAWIGEGAGYSTSIIDEFRTYSDTLNQTTVDSLYALTGVTRKMRIIN